MKVAQLTIEQFRFLVEDAIEEKLDEYLGDPDEGLHIREEVIHRLKAQRKTLKPRIPMKQLCKERGITLQE